VPHGPVSCGLDVPQRLPGQQPDLRTAVRPARSDGLAEFRKGISRGAPCNNLPQQPHLRGLDRHGHSPPGLNDGVLPLEVHEIGHAAVHLFHNWDHGSGPSAPDSAVRDHAEHRPAKHEARHHPHLHRHQPVLRDIRPYRIHAEGNSGRPDRSLGDRWVRTGPYLFQHRPSAHARGNRDGGNIRLPGRVERVPLRPGHAVQPSASHAESFRVHAPRAVLQRPGAYGRRRSGAHRSGYFDVCTVPGAGGEGTYRRGRDRARYQLTSALAKSFNRRISTSTASSPTDRPGTPRPRPSRSRSRQQPHHRRPRRLFSTMAANGGRRRGRTSPHFHVALRTFLHAHAS